MKGALKVLAGVAIALALTAQVFAQGEVLYVINDKVGIGVVSPAAPLHVYGNYVDVNTPQFRVETPGGGGVVGLYVGGVLKTRFRTDSAGNLAFEGTGSGNVDFNYLGGTGPVNFWNGSAGLRATITNTGLGIGVASPAYPIHLASGARCTVGGVWTDASSREYKQDIKDLSAEEAEGAFSKLTPVVFAYKALPAEYHVGFIAEDVPALVATGDRTGLSAMDIVAVLTKVLQEQQKTIAELQYRVAQLETK